MPGCLLRAPGFFIEMDPAAQPQPFVEFRDVRFGYGARAILDGVSFSLPHEKKKKDGIYKSNRKA